MEVPAAFICEPLFFVFFLGIGFGFMLVEISQMQRLIVFLGHPIYSLAVVLFSLLLSSGLGSFSTQKIINSPSFKAAGTRRMALLLSAIVVFGLLTPYVISVFQGASTAMRIAISVIILCFLGFFMGMPFPLGMKMASAKSSQVTPWFWGINGAASVCASVLAIVIALGSGISTTFWTGFICYIAAFLSFVYLARK